MVPSDGACTLDHAEVKELGVRAEALEAVMEQLKSPKDGDASDYARGGV